MERDKIKESVVDISFNSLNDAPSLVEADVGKILKVNSGHDGYELDYLNKNSGVLRQAIINGSMNVSQEKGTTETALTSGDYILDMFMTWFSGDMTYSGQQLADHPYGSQYSTFLKCTAADTSIDAADYALIRTTIEGYNFFPYIEKTATLSFWVKAFKTGIYCISFENSGGDRSYVSEYTVNDFQTWEYKTITLDFDYSGGTWNYTNGIGLNISWAICCGSTYQTTADAWVSGDYIATANQVNACDSVANNFRIAQVQLNEGSSALPFEHEDYGTTLAKCQRYFENTLDHWQDDFLGYVVIGCRHGVGVSFKVTKRLVPTIVTTDVSNARFPSGNPLVSKTIHGFRADKTATSTGVSGYFIFTWTADARF